MKITRSLVVVFLCLAVSAHAADELIALKAARMFDGKSNALVQNGVVVVQGDKIVDAGSNLPIPSAAHVIDLGDATLCPGFMDAHTHLTLDFSGDYNQRRLKEVDVNVSEQAIIATAYARATVEAGFTTVRDLGSHFVGSREFVDVALRNSINKRRDRRAANAGSNERDWSHWRTLRFNERFSRFLVWTRAGLHRRNCGWR